MIPVYEVFTLKEDRKLGEILRYEDDLSEARPIGDLPVWMPSMSTARAVITGTTPFVVKRVPEWCTS